MMRVALIAAVIGGGLLAGAAAADPRPMSAGAQPAPTTSTEIAVAREDLTIRVIGREARVNARLRLRNLGATARTLVGFPCERGLERGVLALDCKTRITVKIGGKKVRTTRKGKHWVWRLRLAAGAETDLEVSYRARLRNDNYKNPVAGMGLLHYRLTTGAAWAGPIGELRMRVELPTEAVLFIAPAGYKRERGVIEWKLRDVEPTHDVAILVQPFYSSRYLRAVDSEGERRATELRKLATDMKRDPERLAKTAQTLLRALGTGLGLPAAPADEIAKTAAESIRIIESVAGRDVGR
jgi:hypothetical protein